MPNAAIFPVNPPARPIPACPVPESITPAAVVAIPVHKVLSPK